MNNKDMLEIAMQQSAVDCGCEAEDFKGSRNVVVISKKNDKARKYLTLPFDCNLVYYGNGIVASVSENLADTVQDYIRRFEPYHCFETPNLCVLKEKLAPYGLGICFMAEYFLPDVSRLEEQPCGFETRLLEKPELEALYLPQWSNALCEKRKELDIMAFGAFDGEKLIGLAGCSADCDTMWQIGVDVLPEYRRRNTAACLTGKLASEIMKRGKVPFYCCAWSNIASARTAIKSGFRPAWVELTAKPQEYIREMNEEQERS